MIDPWTCTCEVFVLQDGEYVLRAALNADDTLRSALPPGLDIPLAEVFAEDAL